jgi:hypothetical protein
MVVVSSGMNSSALFSTTMPCDGVNYTKPFNSIDELFVQAQIIARYLIGAGHGANEEHEAAELFGAREQAQRRLAVAAEPIEQHCECRRPTNDHDAGIHD